MCLCLKKKALNATIAVQLKKINAGRNKTTIYIKIQANHGAFAKITNILTIKTSTSLHYYDYKWSDLRLPIVVHFLKNCTNLNDKSDS